MSRKTKIIILVGPTASGKSELAVKLAKALNGEIISADSRQIYKYLNIGTGKVEGEWEELKTQSSKFKAKTKNSKFFIYKKIPHYCLDITNPKKQYSVAEFKKCAESAISNITARRKLPIVVGGTAFWIDALVYNLNLPDVPPNQKLRASLAKKTARELLAVLEKLDPARAKTIETKNPRRLIRAIEIAHTLGRVPKLRKESPYDALWIGIKLPRNTLKERIHTRLLARLQNGMIAEAKKLRARGVSWKRFYELGLEYRFLADHISGKISKQEMIAQLERAINDYARRQMTWWRRNLEVKWIANEKSAGALAKAFSKK